MHRSHSRHSYPFDKLVPESATHHYNKPWPGVEKSMLYIFRDYSSAARQVTKHMHNKKQRTHNKELCRKES